MSATDKPDTSPERELIESTWAEARDLIRRLEGSKDVLRKNGQCGMLGPQGQVSDHA